MLGNTIYLVELRIKTGIRLMFLYKAAQKYDIVAQKAKKEYLDNFNKIN